MNSLQSALHELRYKIDFAIVEYKSRYYSTENNSRIIKSRPKGQHLISLRTNPHDKYYVKQGEFLAVQRKEREIHTFRETYPLFERSSDLKISDENFGHVDSISENFILDSFNVVGCKMRNYIEESISSSDSDSNELEDDRVLIDSNIIDLNSSMLAGQSFEDLLRNDERSLDSKNSCYLLSNAQYLTHKDDCKLKRDQNNYVLRVDNNSFFQGNIMLPENREFLYNNRMNTANNRAGKVSVVELDKLAKTESTENLEYHRFNSFHSYTSSSIDFKFRLNQKIAASVLKSITPMHSTNNKENEYDIKYDSNRADIFTENLNQAKLKFYTERCSENNFSNYYN